MSNQIWCPLTTDNKNRSMKDSEKQDRGEEGGELEHEGDGVIEEKDKSDSDKREETISMRTRPTAE